MWCSFFILVHRCEDKAKEESFSALTASGITFILTVLFSFPLGAFTVCCVLWCRNQTILTGSKKPQEQQHVVYEEPLPIETAIPMSDNLAYGHVQQTRRN